MGKYRVSRNPVEDFNEKIKMGRAKEGGTKRQYTSDQSLTNTFVRADILKERGEMAGYENFVEANRMQRAKTGGTKLQKSYDKSLTDILVKSGKYNK
tara:strand:+ start:273 stop:563 length:291 start_codon:yes stop_codon:yes gene_type:complete